MRTLIATPDGEWWVLLQRLATDIRSLLTLRQGG